MNRSPALVMYWDESSCYAKCPWCTDMHGHGTPSPLPLPGDHTHTRVPHCTTSTTTHLPNYYLQFPKEWRIFRTPDLSATCWFTALDCDPDLPPIWTPPGPPTLAAASANELDSDANALSFSELNLDEPNEELHDVSLLCLLHAAAVSREENEVQRLLAAGAQVNGWGKNGCTALHLAAMEGHSNILAILSEHGADIDALNHLGHTALMEAALYARLESVKTLLQNGADEAIEVKWCHDGRWIEATARDFAGDGNRRVTSYRKSQYPHDYKEPSDAPLQRRAIFSLLAAPKTRTGGSGAEEPDRPPVLELLRSATGVKNLVERLQLVEFEDPKTVGYLSRGQAYPLVGAVSGYTDKNYAAPPTERHKNFILSNTTWTKHVLTFCDSFAKWLGVVTLKLLPVNRDADQEFDGQFYACHVEKQLIVYYLYEHKILPWDTYQDDEHMTQGIPHRSLNPQCQITVSRQPCENCKYFARIIGEYLDLGINIELVEF
ncbi:hypothetical protein GALMADRAFT_284022 [Galerina marginata CBS 339.88]|uniref:Single-strand DNA deaminase toxin A-like C-terminal domain-containing protein n=1 Tax=Galerina marginata (strain CBS 339.88) TaxID=685588 RepID=A0A067SH88_GALM3|nr:hypothetical protein GALMADRAFT_284022 [Galerina marginata CBS 339.88]